MDPTLPIVALGTFALGLTAGMLWAARLSRRSADPRVHLEQRTFETIVEALYAAKYALLAATGQGEANPRQMAEALLAVNAALGEGNGRMAAKDPKQRRRPDVVSLHGA